MNSTPLRPSSTCFQQCSAKTVQWRDQSASPVTVNGITTDADYTVAPSDNNSDDSIDMNFSAGHLKLGQHRPQFVGLPPIYDHGIAKENPNNFWLPDSGADAHMTPYVSDFPPGSLRRATGTVTIADGKTLQIKGRGVIPLAQTDSVKNETLYWDLEETLFVPRLDRRLISTDFLNEAHGHGVHFEPGYIDFNLRPDDASE